MKAEIATIPRGEVGNWWGRALLKTEFLLVPVGAFLHYDGAVDPRCVVASARVLRALVAPESRPGGLAHYRARGTRGDLRRDCGKEMEIRQSWREVVVCIEFFGEST